jgi:Ca2+-binding EF-hand superfamily protein
MVKIDKNRSSGAMTEDELAEFQAAFDLYDKDGNGHITTDELLSVFRALGQDVDENDVRVC